MITTNDINFQVSNTLAKRLIGLLSEKGTTPPWAVPDKTTIPIHLIALKELSDVCTQLGLSISGIIQYLRMLRFVQPITFDLEKEQVHPCTSRTRSLYDEFILFCPSGLPNDLLLPDMPRDEE